MPNEFDYHFLILAPGLQGTWFTQAARQYWLKFQPIVTEDPELLSYIPPDASVAVTLLARQDNVEQARRRVTALRRDAHLDVIVAQDLPHLEAMLNRRAEADTRFTTEERA
jgi:hypothetical protein